MSCEHRLAGWFGWTAKAPCVRHESKEAASRLRLERCFRSSGSDKTQSALGLPCRAGALTPRFRAKTWRTTLDNEIALIVLLQKPGQVRIRWSSGCLSGSRVSLLSAIDQIAQPQRNRRHQLHTLQGRNRVKRQFRRHVAKADVAPGQPDQPGRGHRAKQSSPISLSSTARACPRSRNRNGVSRKRIWRMNGPVAADEVTIMSTVPICAPSITSRSLPSAPAGKICTSIRPSVRLATSPAKCSAAR